MRIGFILALFAVEVAGCSTPDDSSAGASYVSCTLLPAGSAAKQAASSEQSGTHPSATGAGNPGTILLSSRQTYPADSGSRTLPYLFSRDAPPRRVSAIAEGVGSPASDGAQVSSVSAILPPTEPSPNSTPRFPPSRLAMAKTLGPWHRRGAAHRGRSAALEPATAKRAATPPRPPPPRLAPPRPGR